MTRAEKIQSLIDDCLAIIPGGERETYRQIAEYAVELGYTPKPIKTARGISDDLTFTKSKVNRTLLKIRRNKHGRAELVLSFFATPVYSEIFRQGIKEVIEAFGGRYTGCYGCGRCKGKPQGYTYAYPDGKTVFRCGGELIRLPPVETSHLGELKAMMKTQDEFWMSLIAG